MIQTKNHGSNSGQAQTFCLNKKTEHLEQKQETGFGKQKEPHERCQA
jgi:hypothetical protein